LTDLDSQEVDASSRGRDRQPAALWLPAKDLRVSFDRAELADLMNLYGRRVAAGEWRDYALDFLRDKAVFSVYRRATEYPIYRIEKNPRLARKQGAYAVLASSGLVLKRGHDLRRVLRVLDTSLRLIKA
jgi:hypothetical protein